MSETIQELRREIERLKAENENLRTRCVFLANAAASAMELQAREFRASYLELYSRTLGQAESEKKK